MKHLIMLTLLIIMSGCTSHWVTKENEEKRLSSIEIENRYKLNVEPIKVKNFWGNTTTFVQMDGFTKVDTAKFDAALKNAMNASKYFQIVNENDAPILKITMQATDHGMRGDGFAGYMLTLGTMPFPVMKREDTVTLSLHTPDGLQIKEYSYPIKMEGSLTVWTPFALFLGEPVPTYTKNFMDVIISQFISDLNRDQLLINI